MKKIVLILSLAFFLPSLSFAHNCPSLIAEIDEILASKPDLDEETIVDEDNAKTVRELRDEGESLHINGDHDASVEILEKALELLHNEV